MAPLTLKVRPLAAEAKDTYTRMYNLEGDGTVPSVGIRELQRDASGVVGRVASTRRPTIVTNRGEAVAVVVPVDHDALEDFVLASAPAFVGAMRSADRDLIAGRTRGSDEVFDELEATPAPRSTRARQPSSTRLTQREHTVLQLLADGRTNRQIAEQLRIKPPTVKRHIEHILAKLEPVRTDD